MAAALGITDADASDNVRESYSDELIRDARRRPQLVAMLESTFAEFIRDPSAKRRALPVMKADDRRVAHTLAGKPPAIPPLTAHYRAAALDARCVAVHHAACPSTSMPATLLHVHHAHRAATF
jgi:nitrate reductase cytochrome c-type subunit